MRNVSDIELMAYVDSELSAKDQQKVEKILATDPSAERRLRAFSMTGREGMALFDKPIGMPIPDRLLMAVQSAPDSKSSAHKVLRGKRWRHQSAWGIGRYQSVRPWYHALAYTCALAAGGGLGWIIHSVHLSQPSANALLAVADGGLRAGSELNRIFDTVPSGQLHSIVSENRRTMVKPVLTFTQKDGGYCRQYELQEVDGPQFDGVACRDGLSQWRVVIHATAPATASLDTRREKLVPAGRRPSVVVSAAMDHLMKGDALSAEVESMLISRRWPLNID